MAVSVYKIGKNILQREKLLFVKTQKGWKNGLVLFGPVCDPNTTRGTLRWKTRFIRGRRGTLGICRTDVDMTTYVNQTDRGWGFYQPNGKIGHAGPAIQEYGAKFAFENAIVEVELDCDAQTIGFYVNGKFQGIAFRDVFFNLPEGKGLCAAISLYNAGDCIQIMDSDRKSKASSASKQLSSPSRSRNSLRVSRRAVPPVEVLQKHADVIAQRTGQGLAVTKKRKGWNNGLLLVAGTRHRHWNFHIKAGTKITCGVCTEDVDLEGYVNKTDKGWGLYALYGTCGTAGPAKQLCCDPVAAGDIVSVFLLRNTDPNYHTLAFAVNGKKPIPSFKVPINTIYYGAVSLYGAEDHVVITTGTPLGKPQNEYAVKDGPRRSSRRVASPAQLASPARPRSVAPEPAGRASSRRLVDATPASPSGVGAANGSGPVAPSFLYCSPHVKFFQGNLIKTQKGWDDGLVLFGPAARKGLLYGKFQVLSGARTTIGVGETDVQRQGYLNKTVKGWGYYQATGRIGHAGPAQKEYGRPYRESGTIVEVEVDLAHGTVQYWLNGQDQGYAFGHPNGADKQKLPRLPPNKEYVIAVSLFELNASVKYLGAKREPPGLVTPISPEVVSPEVFSPAFSPEVIDLAADDFSPPPISQLQKQLPEAPAPVKEPPHVLKEESRDEAAEENVQNDVEFKEADLMSEFWQGSKSGGTYFAVNEIVLWLRDTCLLPPDVAEALGVQMEDDGFDSVLALMSLTRQDLIEMHVHPTHAKQVFAALGKLSRLSDCRLKHGGMEVVCEIGTFHNPGMPVMQVHIKKSDGTSFAVEAAISDTVRQLKERVSSCEHVTLDQMQLIYAGRYLQNEDSLEEHAVEHDSNIYLVVTDNQSEIL